MTIPRSIPSHILIILLIFTSSLQWRGTTAQSLPLQNGLRNDSESIKRASTDYGNIIHKIPNGVLYPSSVKDIIDLIKSSNLRGSSAFTIAAKGRGHSVRGQAMARGGVVVDMTSLSKKGRRFRVYGNSSLGFYADVGAEQLWIDVLKETMNHGLAPVSFTDYLYATVGGTLSNAGIGGQTFLHGPQINNVLELDVITGKGEFITCSTKSHPKLFFGALGGLGQFGIITRARIILDKAPTRVAHSALMEHFKTRYLVGPSSIWVKWARLVYSNFSRFTRDEEHLISSNAPNFVEGFLITNENTTNEWRSSFSSPSRQSDIVSLLKKQGILYTIELVKYYNNQTATTIDKEFHKLLKELNFIPGLIFSTDVPLFDFLNRVGNLDNPKGPLESHPWLNLFIPKSRIFDFNAGVLATMMPTLNQSSDIYIFYPFNRNKWDDRMSAVIPDEDVFYTLGLLHTTRPDAYQIIDKFNNQILEFCERNGIIVKQYLPNYGSKQEWTKHYGSKWGTVLQRKSKFDPKRILSPGQRIFNSI